AVVIARGWGVRRLGGADREVLTAPAGRPAILDGVGGRLIVDPSPRETAAVAAANGRYRGSGPAPALAALPRTADGQEITLLCNAASAAETRLGLAAGAAGVGLLRTEIPFTGARPSRISAA